MICLYVYRREYCWSRLDVARSSIELGAIAFVCVYLWNMNHILILVPVW